MNLLRKTIRKILLENKPKLVPGKVPSYSADIQKLWEVMIDGEKIGELTKIDRMVRDGRHYTDGDARERGWQAFKGQRPYDSRSRSHVFRRKQELSDVSTQIVAVALLIRPLKENA